MTDELKHELRQLVADPPPPSGVPSEVLYERIRTLRRRRAAWAAAAGQPGRLPWWQWLRALSPGPTRLHPSPTPRMDPKRS
jgi:hypothetical protein